MFENNFAGLESSKEFGLGDTGTMDVLRNMHLWLSVSDSKGAGLSRYC